MFSGYVHPKEALAAALGESNMTVELILYVSQAWCFYHLSCCALLKHIACICLLRHLPY